MKHALVARLRSRSADPACQAVSGAEAIATPGLVRVPAIKPRFSRRASARPESAPTGFALPSRPHAQFGCWQTRNATNGPA